MMPETMLTPTGVKLYGRVITELHTGHATDEIVKAAIDAAATAASQSGATIQTIRSAVEKAIDNLPKFGDDDRPGYNKFLAAQLRAKDAVLARIYSFSYEGQYYELPKPAIFLVHDQGKKAVSIGPHGHTDVDTSGVMAKEWEFSVDGDLFYWEYDKGDFSIRLDMETGPFEQILLAAQLRGSAAFGSGADQRSGADLRAGADLRSGADLRRR